MLDRRESAPVLSSQLPGVGERLAPELVAILKQRNHNHSIILRNLAKKWIKILFALWSQGITYDEWFIFKISK
ncbi:MAG: hypothetical protein U0586_16090 [Candidatus Brocadiaceae bacterium]